jgi:hypothetical protein
VDLQGGGSWQTQSSATTFTDNNGSAFWHLTCLAPGNQPLSVAVNGTGYPLNLPACVEPQQDTTPTTSVSHSSTTTR